MALPRRECKSAKGGGRRRRGRRNGEEFDKGGGSVCCVVCGVCVVSVSCPLDVHDLASSWNILMKDAFESKNHEITYLVDQRHADTSGSSSSSSNRSRETKSERRVNIKTQSI